MNSSRPFYDRQQGSCLACNIISLWLCSSPTISSLLAMTGAFLGQAPPKVPEAVRCLLAVLSLAPPPRIEARTRLQLGLTLYHHTNNLLEAREHLDKAVSMIVGAEILA